MTFGNTPPRTRQQANQRLTHLTPYEDYEDNPISGADPPHRFLQSEPDLVMRVALMQLEVAGECTLLASVHLPSRRMGAHDESSCTSPLVSPSNTGTHVV